MIIQEGDNNSSPVQVGSSGGGEKWVELREIYWLPWQRKNEAASRVLALKAFIWKGRVNIVSNHKSRGHTSYRVGEEMQSCCVPAGRQIEGVRTALMTTTSVVETLELRAL